VRLLLCAGVSGGTKGVRLLLCASVSGVTEGVICYYLLVSLVVLKV